MEEYIKKLLEQVRFQKAHKAIEDEIRAHIEDQIEDNMSEGMDKETAEKRAVEDMGNPVDVRIELDKVHSPKIAWSVVIAALTVAVFGMILHVYLAKEFNSYHGLFFDKQNYKEVECRYILGSLLGIFAMFLIYFIDYATVSKYAKVLGTGMTLLFVSGYFLIEKLGNNNIILSHGLDNKELITLGVVWKKSLPLMLLFILLYPGILYKYREQKSKAICKALLWILVPCGILFLDHEWVQAIILEMCMLVELTISLRKEWIRVPKISTLVLIWPFFISLPLFVISFVYKYKPLTFYLQSFRGNDIKTAARMFGKSTVVYDLISYVDDGVVNIPIGLLIPVSGMKGSRILSYISLSWGIFAGLVVVGIIAGMIALGVKATSKIKNQLGVVLGSGCITFLIINTIIGMFSGFGMIEVPYSFLPFVSGNGIVVSYVFLGIILSIYKYKDIYAEHVDIMIRDNVKDT